MKEKLINLLKNQLEKNNIDYSGEFTIEVPKNKDNGDYSSNIAMKLAGLLHKKPLDIANDLTKDIKDDFIKKIEVVNPGFINFYLEKDYLKDNINNVIDLNEKYGSSNIGNNKKINIEFVSANPTGILHLGNARGGAYGDSLARIMKFSGFDITKEYYLNDAGVQITKLAKSIKSKYLTLCGVENDFPEDGYPGKEIDDIAHIIYEENDDKLVNEELDIYKKYGIDYLTGHILNDLKEYRITYDTVTSEKSIYEKYDFDKIINELDEKGYIYQKDGATWLKSSDLLDDQDHVLIKKDGEKTYLMPDIIYHKDKFDRPNEELIDVLGTDHHGYVPRIKSALKALGYNPNNLDVRLLQLVRLVKNGQVVTMHKRDGNVVTLKDLVDEVGVNAARYYFSKSSLDTQMDFDIELAKSNTSENPVYYVCYAYARICSILNKYPKLEKLDNYDTLTDDAAYNVLASIYKFPEVVKNACIKRSPHIITNYVYELASTFHNYYEQCRVISDDENQTLANLNLILCVKITLRNALDLIGVVPQERM